MVNEYWCEECYQWVDSSEVTHDLEQIEENRPLVDRYIHDPCGMEATPADEY